jgi:DNA-binding IclR family transcriptional regulator
MTARDLMSAKAASDGPAEAIRPRVDATEVEPPTARGALPVESVRRALRILGCFGPGRGELGVTDVAGMLNMHKSTVHRLLLTLEQEGFVRQVSGRYALTWRLLEIASGIPVRDGIRQTALRHLAKLSEQTGETAHLAVLYSGEVLYVEKVEGTRALRMPSAVGRRVPLHCTALGKVLLAGLDEHESRHLMFSAPLTRFTPDTVTDPMALREQISQVRRQGYAIDREEIEEGLGCIGAPVVAGDGSTCAGISISGPASRLEARLEDNVAAVRDTAAALSAELGALAQQLRDTWTT